MLLPYSTDAPIYHFPCSTIGLIVANTVIFGMMASGPEFEDSIFHGWMLHFNQIHPMQWVGNNFLHASLGHLLGNMFFLWAFGLVVEGKLGWWRFLITYLGIGTVYGALVQSLMFVLSDRTGAAVGASGVIFGLSAMAAVWAPKNDLHCLIFVWIIPRQISISLLVFAGIYIAFELFLFVASDMAMSSSALHLAGFLVGLPIAILMLKFELVDCEGWDLLNLFLDKRTGSTLRRDKSDAKKVIKKDIHDRDLANSFAHSRSLDAIRELLKEGRVDVALKLYLRHAGPDCNRWNIPVKDLSELVRSLLREKKWSESVPLLVQILRRAPGQSNGARLKLAQIMLQVEDRPRQAMALLERLPNKLPMEHETRRTQLKKLAENAIQEGSLEMEIEDW